MIDTKELRQLAQAATPGPRPRHRRADMTPAEVAAKLRQFNEWRRGDYEPSEQPEPPNPYEVGLAIDAAVELLDRLEAAERERDRYKLAYNDWIAKTEWLREEIARSLLPAKYLGMHRADAIKLEIDRLRARVEEVAEMERQEPVAFALYSGWALKATYLKEHEACEQRDRRQLTADLSGSLEAYRVVPLYTLPGAKGEEK